MKKMFESGIWNIGYTNQSVRELFENKGLSDINWLLEDSTGDYSADPFIFELNGSEYIAYEYLNFTKGKGRNFVIDLDEGFSNKKPMNYSRKFSCHQSYPYIFEDQGDLYCVPETSELNKVILFRCDGTPGNWTECATLLRDFPGVDSSIALINKTYWLFSTPVHDQSILNLYHSDAVKGPYRAHKHNPVIKSSYARMAGSIFRYNDLWYRPSQDLSSKYGAAIILNRIDFINNDSYRESPALTLYPQKPYSDGLHTISIGNHKIVVDGRRKQISMTTPIRKLIRRIRTKKL